MKHKKEFFGVLLSVLVCVFLVFLAVYATTVGTDITVTGDATVSGNDITFGNGAVLSNQDADWLTLTEANVSVSGDFGITGNDLTFGNGAVLSNQDADWLTLTETNVSVSGDFGITGNDLKFGNGGTIINSEGDVLLLTETLVSIVGKASVSTDFYVGQQASISQELQVTQGAYFDGLVSVSDSGIVVEGPTITAVVSPSATCTIGSINLDPENGVLSICDASSDWTPVDDD